VTGGMKLGGGVLLGTAGEEIGDLIMNGQKPLHLPRRFEPLHDPLSSRWLVGILRPVVEALVLAVLDAGHDLPLGRGIALQLVGDQHARRPSLLLQQFAQQALGRLLVAPALNEDIENKALLIDRAPEPVLLTGDGNDDLIKVPLVAAPGCPPTDAVGIFPAEFQAPLPAVDLLRSSTVGDRNAASCQHLLDHASSMGTGNTARPHN
jgi:hypothetical protein